MRKFKQLKRFISNLAPQRRSIYLSIPCLHNIKRKENSVACRWVPNPPRLRNHYDFSTTADRTPYFLCIISTIRGVIIFYGANTRRLRGGKSPLPVEPSVNVYLHVWMLSRQEWVRVLCWVRVRVPSSSVFSLQEVSIYAVFKVI